MKALSLALAAALGIPAASAAAAVITIGSPLALDCYTSAEKRDRNPDALEVCTRALQEPLGAEDRAATLVNRGVLRMIRSDLAGAEADFNEALALRPSLSDAWLNKGFLRVRTGDGSNALPFIEKALELSARRPALAYFARGIAHEQAGNIRAAYADLSRARDLEPGWPLPEQELSRYRVVER